MHGQWRRTELHLSVGAALLNLRVAILAHGRQPLTQLFPLAAEPDLVARMVLGPSLHRSETVLRLANAIPRRRTSRRPFADVPVGEPVLAELHDAARAEGATLLFADSVERDAVLSLVRRRVAWSPKRFCGWGTGRIAHPHHAAPLPSCWSVVEPASAMEAVAGGDPTGHCPHESGVRSR